MRCWVNDALNRTQLFGCKPVGLNWRSVQRPCPTMQSTRKTTRDLNPELFALYLQAR